MWLQIPGKAQYVVWVLTVGGVIYRVHVTGAAAGWMLCGNQQHDASVDIQRMHEVTAFAVTPNVFCLGGQTGSIICVPFGTGSPSTSGAGELLAHACTSVRVFHSTCSMSSLFKCYFYLCLD